MFRIKLADSDTQIVATGCPVCGRHAGGEAVHSVSYAGRLVFAWAALPVCDDCAGRLAAGAVDLESLAKRGRVLLGGFGFSAN